MNIMNFAVRDVVTIRPEDSLDKAISLMEERDIHHLPVCQAGGELVGMLSDRDVLLSTGWMLAAERRIDADDAARVIGPTRVEQVMSRRVRTLSSSDSAADAARTFMAGKLSAVPIMQQEQLVGVIADSDLLRWLDHLALTGSASDRFLARAVGELMRTSVVAVRGDAPLADVVDILRRRRIRHIPVCAAGRLVGIISDRDVRRALGWSNVRDSEAQEQARLFEGPLHARDVMQTRVYTVGVADTLRAALRRMLHHRIHSLPVMSDDRLVGIITTTDYIRAIARDELL